MGIHDIVYTCSIHFVFTSFYMYRGLISVFVFTCIQMWALTKALMIFSRKKPQRSPPRQEQPKPLPETCVSLVRVHISMNVNQTALFFQSAIEWGGKGATSPESPVSLSVNTGHITCSTTIHMVAEGFQCLICTNYCICLVFRSTLVVNFAQKQQGFAFVHRAI